MQKETVKSCDCINASKNSMNTIILEIINFSEQTLAYLIVTIRESEKLVAVWDDYFTVHSYVKKAIDSVIYTIKHKIILI